MSDPFFDTAERVASDLPVISLRAAFMSYRPSSSSSSSWVVSHMAGPGHRTHIPPST